VAERRLKAARFPAAKLLDEFDFAARPSVNKLLLLQDYLDPRENLLLVGPSGIGKSHLMTALGMAACDDQVAVLRGPLVGVLGHGPRAIHRSRIYPEGRISLLRPVLGSPDELQSILAPAESTGQADPDDIPAPRDIPVD
jgi:hypothetical protein